VSDPIALFREWAAQAKRPDIPEPDAAALATVDAHGRPSVRMVLVRGADERGFTFYTNFDSPKAADLLRGAPAYASLCFWWPTITKQIRVEGTATPLDADEADAYWSSRERGSQVSAWASRQSAVLAGGREELERRFHELDRTLPREGIPRPPYWSGFRVKPDRMEFWQGMPHRLHHRRLYVRDGDGWITKILSP